MSALKILGCPFCGDEPMVVKIRSSVAPILIKCSEHNSEARASGDSVEEAAANWNQRACTAREFDANELLANPEAV